MNKEQFQEEIESFVRMHCSEYAKGDPVYVIEFFDPEDPTAAEASVTITTFGGRTWEVPIGVCSTRNGEGEVVIAPDCTYLELNGDGLYAYLWNEAANRLKDAENKIERLERRMEKLVNQNTDYRFGVLS